MSAKSPRIKKLSEEERLILYVVLVVWLGSFAMMVYSYVTAQDSTIWQLMFASILSAMGGFLIGVNRPK